MVNSSAICQRIAAGTHPYAAILIFDRDQDIVGRRLGGALHHDYVVRRRLDRSGRAQRYRQ